MLQGVLRGLGYLRLESLLETSATNAILFVLLGRVLDKFSTSHMFIFINYLSTLHGVLGFWGFGVLG